MVKIPSAGTTAIPVVLLMRALGMENDRDIFSAIAEPVEAMKYTVANLNDVKDNPEYGVDNTERQWHGLRRNSRLASRRNTGESRIQNLLDKGATAPSRLRRIREDQESNLPWKDCKAGSRDGHHQQRPQRQGSLCQQESQARWRPNGRPIQSWCSRALQEI